MKFYFAPLETVTGYRYRKYHNKYYRGVDKYFIPFISPTSTGLRNKELKEISKDNNNLSVKVVPQILSKNSLDSINVIRYLESIGYDEINLNFGCPSGTVVPKGKGGGILKDLIHLDEYLKDIFENINVKISIKIRLGLESEEEFDEILNVLNKYPIYELIIHPRCVKDFYKGSLHLDYLDNVFDKTNFDIIYNGDINTISDVEYIKKRYPKISGIMIGRGLIRNPDLLDNGEYDHKERLYQFYKELIKDNRMINGDNNSLHYEKELLVYLIDYFDCPKNIRKNIFKTSSSLKMDELIDELFKCDIKVQDDGLCIYK